MIRTICMYFLSLLVAFLAFGVRAQDTAGAEALVKNVTNEVLRTLREDKDIQSGNRQRAISVIETQIAPHFDFGRMTSLAVGGAWRRANADQRRNLTQEFRTLLVRTYANALTQYRNQSVAFKPAKPGEGGDVRVPCLINQPGRQAISLVYHLSKSDGEWKVYDVVIEDISLVTNYRGSFAAEMEEGGIDGLIETLHNKNKKLQTPAATEPAGKEAK